MVEEGWLDLQLGAGLPCQGGRPWTDVTRPGHGSQLALRVCTADVVDEVRLQLGCPRFWGRRNAKRECPGLCSGSPTIFHEGATPTESVPSWSPAPALAPLGLGLLLCEMGMSSLFFSRQIT